MSGLWIFRRFESTCASVSLQHKNKETITMENKTTTTTVLPVNRTYKSTVFTMLYADKSNLLDLYNAMAGTHYTDPELLEINTLENAIYMTIKNDVSFLIDGQLSLYEHQSTINPNIPLRFLVLYFAPVFADYERCKPVRDSDCADPCAGVCGLL